MICIYIYFIPSRYCSAMAIKVFFKTLFFLCLLGLLLNKFSSIGQEVMLNNFFLLVSPLKALSIQHVCAHHFLDPENHIWGLLLLFMTAVFYPAIRKDCYLFICDF